MRDDGPRISKSHLGVDLIMRGDEKCDLLPRGSGRDPRLRARLSGS